MRKRCHRRPITARPPIGLRCLGPKLEADQIAALAIAHHTHVDLIVNGKGTPELLWEMAGAALGWSRCAEVLGMGETEIAADLETIAAVLKRWERTGRVGYTGLELQRARAGLEVVDQLARLVDLPTALAGMNWAEEEITRRRNAWARHLKMAAATNVQNNATAGSLQTPAPPAPITEASAA